jgi:hypothetical protein
VEKAMDALNQRADKAARLIADWDGSHEVASALNAAMMRAERAVTRLAYTVGSPYHHDPAVPMRLLHGLSEAAALATTSKDSNGHRFLINKLVRERNRALGLLKEAAEALERVV